MEGGYDSPQWTERKLSAISALRRASRGVVDELGQAVSLEVFDVTAEAYSVGHTPESPRSAHDPRGTAVYGATMFVLPDGLPPGRFLSRGPIRVWARRTRPDLPVDARAAAAVPRRSRWGQVGGRDGELFLQAPAPVDARMLGYHNESIAAQAAGPWSRYASGDHTR
ncbi:hypothetical protein [Streptomyces sp. NPDC088246]|uniref:hypothetical protein n=1 Tax=Streptomyces sp. NPDC088246 TaxID=3365842 RepID=UPI0038308CE9